MPDQFAGFCWMTALQAHPDRLARFTDALKDRVTKFVMTAAAEKGLPLRPLVTALLESAASAAASGIVLDQARKVLCSKTDEQHADAICQQLREALLRQITEARAMLLQPNVAYPTQKEPS